MLYVVILAVASGWRRYISVELNTPFTYDTPVLWDRTRSRQGHSLIANISISPPLSQVSRVIFSSLILAILNFLSVIISLALA